jgi:hypothetical protein
MQRKVRMTFESTADIPSGKNTNQILPAKYPTPRLHVRCMYASRVQPPAFGRARTESNLRQLHIVLMTRRKIKNARTIMQMAV